MHIPQGPMTAYIAILLQNNLAFHNIFVCVCTRNIIRAGGSTPATHAMAGPM